MKKLLVLLAFIAMQGLFSSCGKEYCEPYVSAACRIPAKPGENHSFYSTRIREGCPPNSSDYFKKE